MNAIARIEESIKNGTYPEPTMKIRAYALTMSPLHLEAGSDWRLAFSADTIEDLKEMISDMGCSMDMHMIADGENSEIIYPTK